MKRLGRSRIVLLLFVVCMILGRQAAVSAVVSKASGDLNNDGKVDTADLIILKNNFKTTSAQGDVNSDGKVNIIDLSILAINFNTSNTPEQPVGTLLWSSDYNTPQTIDDDASGWQNAQYPNVNPAQRECSDADFAASKCAPQSDRFASGYKPNFVKDRIQLVDQSGADLQAATGTKPSGKVARFELHKYNEAAGGETTTTGSYQANRVEAYARQPASSSSTTVPKNWPDPIDSDRWYNWSFYLPSTGPNAYQPSDNWMVLTQFKGRDSGSPPLSINVLNNTLKSNGKYKYPTLGPGVRLALESVIYPSNWESIKTTASTPIKEPLDLGPLNAGAWTTLTLGIHWSIGSDGSINAFRDGKEWVTKADGTQPTMSYYKGSPDPNYLKQGIYRSDDWTTNTVMYLSRTKIGTTKAIVEK